ncbi:DUF1643 domain-containing protein [Paeniglutamicibacter psychrophenolicus]|uniref:DUF1643 domain-containing protein n=1 Tax=Paeniglutamicibacter psychrophenolicus TaxID=257454 RepID=UPI0035945129
MTRLLAVLLNPPLTSGVASLRHVEAARLALACDSVLIANLFSEPTRSVEDINVIGKCPEGWTQSREQLLNALDSADVLMGAWGISGLTGEAARMRKSQVAWLAQSAMDQGFDKLWTVGGTPRHPSRWHQYVSDKYQRAVGETLELRLSSVLSTVDLADFT